MNLPVFKFTSCLLVSKCSNFDVDFFQLGQEHQLVSISVPPSPICDSTRTGLLLGVGVKPTLKSQHYRSGQTMVIYWVTLPPCNNGFRMIPWRLGGIDWLSTVNQGGGDESNPKFVRNTFWSLSPYSKEPRSNPSGIPGWDFQVRTFSILLQKLRNPNLSFPLLKRTA